MSRLTDLIVMELRVTSFDEWMMMLAIKDESVGRTSNLIFLESLNFGLLGSRNDRVVSEKIARRRNLNHTTIDVFNGCHWCVNDISILNFRLIPNSRR